MRRAYAAAIFILLFSLVFMPGKVAGFSSPCSQSNNLVPPFIASGVKPNILILLDVSQSMDEDFYGQAVGSYAPTSKSVIARIALQNMVAQLKQKANVGVMTFTLNSDVSQGDPYFIYNLMPFTSYQISSYCPSPTAATLAACQDYCVTGDSTDQSLCQSGCSQLNSSFSTNFTDLLLDPANGGYPFNDTTGIRAGYCAVAYPKLYAWQDPSGGPIAYHSASDALYISPNGSGTYPAWGTASEYGYCDNYSTAQNAPNSYNFYQNKSNQSDGGDNNGNPGGYSNFFTSAQFQPTDSDWALGFYNFGVRQPFYYVGPTIFSGTSPSSSQGFLHVAVGDLTGSAQFHVGVTNSDQYDNVYDILIPNCDDGTNCNSGTDGTPYAGNPSDYWNYKTPYMLCSPSNGNYNTCPYLINAGNTPTAGALQSALNYLNGNYKYSGSTVPTPITQPCQQNFIILVTDGLPDTTLAGQWGVNGTTNYTAIAQQQAQAVLEELDGQSQPSTLPAGMTGWQNVTMKQNGTTYTFNVKTYVLGLGLTTLAKTNLDAMATAGGTAGDNGGHAYYANSPAELETALQNITGSLFSGVSAGSSVSVLASQSENGANVLQGIFYTTKTFGSGNNSITWPGYLYDWWFYNGPVYQNIREDTLHDFILELGSDDVLNFTFNMTNGLQIQRDTPETNGSSGPLISTGGLDSLTPIWEAGKMLWAQSPDNRTIYTPSQDGQSLVSFNTSNSTLTTPGTSPLGYPSHQDPCLTGNTTSTNLDNLISYVRGNDLTANICESTTGSIEYLCSDGNGNYNTTACTADSDCAATTSDPYCMPVTCSTSSDCTNTSYPTCSPDSCRNRTVNLCVQDASTIATAGSVNISGQGCSTDSDCTAPYSTCSPSTPPNTWKLGDIVYSTPKVVASFSYCSTTSGTTFQSPVQACTSDADCTNSNYPLCTQKESVVFVGANDGMLHAFESGVLSTSGLDGATYQVDKLIGIPTSNMGSELWGFVPTNVLPYLRCLAVPPPNSCHLYYNDLSPYITTMYVDYTGQVCANVDPNGNVISYTTNPCTTTSSCASGQECESTTLSTPHTVLIGGLRLGGGAVSGSQANYCFNSAGISNGVTCNNLQGCQTAPYTASCAPAYPTNVPTDTCPGGVAATSVSEEGSYTPSSCIGLSSYYALDITDVENPKLLWEFSDPQLGYSYSGPAVIHKWTSSTTPLTGDQYDVMFLSGPTDPHDGSSIQNLQAFILKLDPATLRIDSVYQTDFKNNGGNSIANAFGGRLFTTGLDVDSDGYTDYVFFGYSSSPNGSASNWSGGIGFVYTDAYTTSGQTNSIDPVNGVDPSKWTYDVKTYDNIPQVPITAQIATEPCWYNLDGSPLTYLFAGTGRYFFPMDNYGSNGNSGYNFIMGVPFTCNDVYQNCGSPNVNSLNGNNDACSALTSATSAKDLTQAGWLIDLAAATTNYGSERMITDPTTAPVGANGGNVIYFTTTEPTNNPCGYGGETFLYGLNCATGSSIASTDCSNYVAPGTGGSIYIQTSTGAINAISSSTSFTQNNGRETQPISGIAPEGGAVFLPPGSTGGKTGQIIQWIEK